METVSTPTTSNIFVTTGYDGTSTYMTSSEIVSHDSVASSYSVVSSIAYPLGLYGAQGFIVGDSIIVCGGDAKPGVGTCHQLQLTGGSGSPSWSSIASMSAARVCARVVRLSPTQEWMTGGTAGGKLSTTEIFDTNTLTWSAGVSLPYATERHAIVSIGNNQFLLTGGENGRKRAEKFDSVTETWTSMASLSIDRSCHFSFVGTYQGNTVVFVGGGASGDAQPSTEYINLSLSSPTWQTGPTLPTDLYCASVLVTSTGETYIFGDQSDQVIVTYANDQFTILSGTTLIEKRGFTVALEIPMLP